MQNKNIQEKISVNLLNPKSQREIHQRQGLKLEGCQCSVCKGKAITKGQCFQPIEKDENNLQQFIKQFPSNFPLTINATTSYNPQKGYHLHYYNGNRLDNKFFIFQTKVSKLLTNHPMASNIQIFGNNFSKIIAKHELMSFLRKFQQKASNSHRKIMPHQLPMTKSLILPSLTDSGQISQKNPEQRQDQMSSVLSSKYKHSKVLYVQAYTNQIPIQVYYEKKIAQTKLDMILLEYLDEEVQNFHPQKSYTINEQFWQWVYTEYGEQIFSYFVTEFYCRAYEFFSKHKVIKAIFYWVFQKPKAQFGQNTKVTEQLGRHKQMLEAQYFISKVKKLAFKIKLGNMKNITIEYHRNFRSFQEEYQEIILGKINSNPSESGSANKLIVGNKKAYLYQNRLDSFHSKVRDLFLKEQNKVLNQVESQKQHEGVVDSNKLARLLLPKMGQQQTIRQILNDEHAFQKLIHFQQKKIQKERLRKARQQLLLQKKDSSLSKPIFEQSRFRNRQTLSKRVRVRTQY